MAAVFGERRTARALSRLICRAILPPSALARALAIAPDCSGRWGTMEDKKCDKCL